MTQSAVLMRSQIGVEALGAKGTLVPATKKLAALGIRPTPDMTFDTFAPEGLKYDTLITPNRESTVAPLTGKPTYNEIVYALASIIKSTTPTQPDAVNAPTVYQWVFESDSDGADDPQTYTIEIVGPDLSYRFTHGLITDFNMNISRDTVDISGNMVGQLFESGITPTSAGLTELELIPILAKHVSVYIDDTAAALGTTKLTSDFVANLAIGGKFGVVYALDRATGSFSKHVDLKPTITLGIQLERNAVGMSPLAAAREGTTKFLRVEAVGGVIEDAFTNEFVLDFAGKVNAAPGFNDRDGLAVADWTFGAVHNATWGKAFSVAVTNALASL